MNDTLNSNASQAELTARWVLFFETLGEETQASPGCVYLAGACLFVYVCQEAGEPSDTSGLAEGFRDTQTVQVLVAGLPSPDSRPLVYCNDLTDSSGGEGLWGAYEPTGWAMRRGQLVVEIEDRRGRVFSDGDWNPCRGLISVPTLTGPDEHVAMAARMAGDAGLYAFPSHPETP